MIRLHSRTPEHDPQRPEPPVPATAEASRAALFAGQVADAVRATPTAALRQGAGILGALARPWETASRAAGRAASAPPWAGQNPAVQAGAELPARRRGARRAHAS